MSVVDNWGQNVSLARQVHERFRLQLLLCEANGILHINFLLNVLLRSILRYIHHQVRERIVRALSVSCKPD